MDHAYIESNGLVERYHRGLLPPDEEARFEEHFVGCSECTEQLELARGFQRGLKAMAAEDAARAVLGAGLFAWLARRGRLAQWGTALALVMVALLPALWLLAGGRSDRREQEARLEAARRARQELEHRLIESESRRSAERRELEARIAQAKPPEPSRGLAGPLVNTPVFLLAAVRSNDAKPATIDLSRTGDALALAVDLGEGLRFDTYRATITRAGGGKVFEKAGLKPNALETLMITFPSSFFAPGDYRLRVEGVKPDGSAAEVGGYAFRVTGKKQGT
ncbi:MAG: zf-HC2 domain-containing protein [Thermoanaerobaculia bacterium]